MNWQPIATISAPIIAFFVGFFVNRWLERRPKLLSFISHANAVQVTPPNGPPFAVHTHSVVVRNSGHAPAKNVRLTHAQMPPNFSVFPSVEYTVIELPSGGKDVVFPVLVPQQQVTVTYLYYPPMLASHVNVGCRSDEGYAKIVSVLLRHPRPVWQRALLTAAVIALVLAALAAAWFAGSHSGV